MAGSGRSLIMYPNLCLRIILATLVISGGIAFGPYPLRAEARFVALPKIENNTVAPRVIYIENPRFPRVGTEDLWKVVKSAAALVEEHFGIKVESPSHIRVLNIDDVFAELVENKPSNFGDFIGDFRNGKVDWEVVRENLEKHKREQEDPLAKQIEFARP